MSIASTGESGNSRQDAVFIWFDVGGSENGDKATLLANIIENSGITIWGWHMDAGKISFKHPFIKQ